MCQILKYKTSHFASLSLTIFHLFGCAFVKKITMKSIDFIKGV